MQQSDNKQHHAIVTEMGIGTFEALYIKKTKRNVHILIKNI